MTFGDQPYDLVTYRSIPFVTTRGRRCFNELFPALPNPSRIISAEKKAHYHAWASMAGNFTSILWSAYFKRLEQEFQINSHFAKPYMQQVFNNLHSDNDPVTGPLARGDMRTIEKHLDSLEHDSFRQIYAAFSDVFTQERRLEVGS